MTASSVGLAGFYIIFLSSVGGTEPRSGDSASIKSYDNRARLIPLPIINARIKLDLSDESAERGPAIAPIEPSLGLWYE